MKLKLLTRMVTRSSLGGGDTLCPHEKIKEGGGMLLISYSGNAPDKWPRKSGRVYLISHLEVGPITAGWRGVGDMEAAGHMALALRISKK